MRARDAGDRRGEGRCRGGSGRGETRREDGQFATTGGFRPGACMAKRGEEGFDGLKVHQFHRHKSLSAF
ncbi:hypothetical protein R3I94_015726 [Phoxinus phoxinus]